MSRTTYHALQSARLTALSAALSLSLASRSLVASEDSSFGHWGAANWEAPTRIGNLHLRTIYAAALKTFESLPAQQPANRAATTVHIASMDDSGPATLRDALSHAVEGDVIDLTGLRGTLTLTAPLIPAAKVSIQGPGRDVLTLDARHLGRVLASNHSLKVSSVTIANGATAVSSLPVGGCLNVHGALSLDSVTLSNCSVDGSVMGFAAGGAVFALGSVSIDSSTFTNNSVSARYHPGGDLSKLYFAYGGALAVYGTPDFRGTTISNSTFTGNSAAGSKTASGGAVASFYFNVLYDSHLADVTLYNTTVSGNLLNATGIAPYYKTNYDQIYYAGRTFAAGISVTGGNLSIVSSHIDHNASVSTGRSFGAGVYVNYGVYHQPNTPTVSRFGGSVSAVRSTISGNTASSTYRGVYAAGLIASNDISIIGSELSNNHIEAACKNMRCFSAGGAIVSGYYTQKIEITDSVLSGNSVTSAYASGGAISTRRNDDGASIIVINSTVSGNTVSSSRGYSYGAGICQQLSGAAGVVKLYNSTIAFNVADGFGGGIVLNGNGPAILNSSIVANNTSAAYAGASDIAVTVPIFTISGDYNLVQTDPSTYGVTLSGTQNIIGEDPKLMPLADNGGVTPTHALGPASPAIDRGNNPLTLSFDQRGTAYPRVVGAHADIGAFELDTDHIFAAGFD